MVNNQNVHEVTWLIILILLSTKYETTKDDFFFFAYFSRNTKTDKLSITLKYNSKHFYTHDQGPIRFIGTYIRLYFDQWYIHYFIPNKTYFNKQILQNRLTMWIRVMLYTHNNSGFSAVEIALKNCGFFKKKNRCLILQKFNSYNHKTTRVPTIIIV